jgi:hypothetical protein
LLGKADLIAGYGRVLGTETALVPKPPLVSVSAGTLKLMSKIVTAFLGRSVASVLARGSPSDCGAAG